MCFVRRHCTEATPRVQGFRGWDAELSIKLTRFCLHVGPLRRRQRPEIRLLVRIVASLKSLFFKNVFTLKARQVSVCYEVRNGAFGIH